MFRTLCPVCTQLVEEKAAQCAADNDIFIVGCSHNRVAASVLVNGGVIIGWNIWPVIDEESFRARAVVQMALLHEFMATGLDSESFSGIVKH